MNAAVQRQPMLPLTSINQSVRFTARTAGLVAAMMLSITWLLLIVPLATTMMPGKDVVPVDWWAPMLLALVCLANTVAGGCFYASVLKRRLSFLLCVVLGYLLLIASSIGINSPHHQLFVGLATLHVLLGAAAAEWLARRYAERLAEKIEAWPKPVRWLAHATYFWSVFLIGYLGLGVAMHDLMARQLGVQRFLY